MSIIVSTILLLSYRLDFESDICKFQCNFFLLLYDYLIIVFFFINLVFFL